MVLVEFKHFLLNWCPERPFSHIIYLDGVLQSTWFTSGVDFFFKHFWTRLLLLSSPHSVCVTYFYLMSDFLGKSTQSPVK